MSTEYETHTARKSFDKYLLVTSETYKTVSYQIDGCIHIWRSLGNAECRALQCSDNLCGVATLNLKRFGAKQLN